MTRVGVVWPQDKETNHLFFHHLSDMLLAVGRMFDGGELEAVAKQLLHVTPMETKIRVCSKEPTTRGNYFTDQARDRV
eukprot:170470-Prorocentrum_minimum.AAC.1